MPLLTDGQPPDDYSSSGGDASSWPGMMYDIRRSANDAPHYCSFLLLSFCTVVYRHGCMPVPATVTATIPFILKTLTGVVLVAHADVTLLWVREAWRFAAIKSAVAPRVFIQYENRWCTGFPFLCPVYSEDLMICAVFILLFLMTHRDMSYPASVLFNVLLCFCVLYIHDKNINQCFISVILISQINITLFILFLLFMKNITCFLICI